MRDETPNRFLAAGFTLKVGLAEMGRADTMGVFGRNLLGWAIGL